VPRAIHPQLSGSAVSYCGGIYSSTPNPLSQILIIGMIKIIPQRKPFHLITLPEVRVFPVVSPPAVSYGVIEKTLLDVNDKLSLGFFVKNSRKPGSDEWAE